MAGSPFGGARCVRRFCREANLDYALWPVSRCVTQAAAGSIQGAVNVRHGPWTAREEVSIAPKKVMGCFLILLGATVITFRELIVFPGLERLIGIEAIVGKENVVYLPEEGYGFTNPAAQMHWISSVGALGVAICSIGAWLLMRAYGRKKNSK
jgi:hypothetical protein